MQIFVIDNFIVHVKTDDIYKDIVEDVQTRSDNTNVEIDRPLPNWKNKKVIGLMNWVEKSWKHLFD